MRFLLFSHMVLLAAWVTTAFPASARQDGNLFNEYGVSPDVWRPAKPLTPGVDARGDLGLFLPVMTIPGRGGLDYTVHLSYRSGIKVKQASSWIGLGWSFDPGSITRDVQSAVYFNGMEQVFYNVDYAEPQPLQPDLYYVSTPGGSFAMTRTMTAPHPVDPQVSIKLPFRGDHGDFFAHEWRPWKIEPYAPAVVQIPEGTQTWQTEVCRGINCIPEAQEDIPGFILTDEDGTRYVFEHPSLSTYTGMHPHAALYSVETYVNTWRLTAIVGRGVALRAVPATCDAEPINTPNDPFESADGNWIRFCYSAPETRYKSSSVQPNAKDLSQTRYLYRIMTPTHWADFEGAGRPCEIQCEGTWSGPLNQKKLTRIALYARTNGALIREVRLSHEAGGHQGINGYDRLALDSLSFYGKNNAFEPGYHFTYYGTEGTGALFDENQDDFGYYTADPEDFNSRTYDGRSWSLKTLTLPTGGHLEVDYEDDQLRATTVSYDQWLNGGIAGSGWYEVSATLHNTRQGGARVKEIRTYDAMQPTPAQTNRYVYTNGRLNGVPEHYWIRSVVGESNDFFSLSSRGQVGVFYETVTQVDADDGTFVSTHYTTNTYAPGRVERQQTMLFTEGAARTVIQGNQHINWGRVHKTQQGGSGGTTRSVIKTLNLHTEKLALGFVGGNKEIHVDWRFAHQVEAEERLGETGEILLRKEFQYSLDDNDPLTPAPTGQVVQVREIEDGGVRTRITNIGYGYEVYPALEATNVLSAVVRQDVAEEIEVPDDGGGGAAPVTLLKQYHAATITTWRPFLVDNDLDTDCEDSPEVCVWHPGQSYQWRALAPSETRPSFDFEAPGGGAWLPTTTFEAYDPYGHVLEQADARGNQTRFFYGNNSSNCTQNGTAFRHANLTCIARGPLSQEIDYNEDGSVHALRGTNGNTTVRFLYDDLGRLQAVENGTGETLTSYSYHVGAVFDPEDPPHVVTVLHTGTTHLLAKSFWDGLGREIQAQTREAADTFLVVATQYDLQGRPWKAWMPYRATGEGYDAAYAPHATASYGVGSTPFAETHYTTDGRAAVAGVIPPYSSTPHSTSASYGVEPLGEGFYTVTLTTDENGGTTKVCKDVQGRTVRQVAAAGTPDAAVTEFVYAVNGNVLEVRPPNSFDPPHGSVSEDWVTHYTYNTLGQLTSKTTPDTATPFRYRYDADGNLRFEEDPNGQAADRFLYNKYDGFNRLLESGVYTGSTAFESAPAEVVDWPTDHRQEVVTYTYDTYGGLLLPTPSGVDLNHPKGNLTQVDFEQGHYQYFYNAEGQVESFYAYLDSLGIGKRLQYEYDLQGKVTQVRFQPGVPGEQLDHWYTYDGAGRLSTVKTGTTGIEAEAVREVAYRYTPAGQVEQLLLGEAPAQAVDYQYHMRGWLTHINNLQTMQADGDRFALHLGYDDPGDVPGATPRFDGTVSWMNWQTEGNNMPQPVVGYSFVYDPLNRLRRADFSAYDGATWQATAAFDVGVTEPIGYDPNGNLLALPRHGAQGHGATLTYAYQVGTNRIQSVQGGLFLNTEPPPAPSFLDAVVPYQYDANGNQTQGRGLDVLQYDRQNMPVLMQTPQGVALATGYDAAGQRVFKNSGPGTGTFYLRDPQGTVVAVYQAGGSLKYWNIVAGGSILGRIEPPPAP